MKIAELFAEIGWQNNSEGLLDFDEQLGAAAKRIGKFGAGIGAAIFLVNKFTASTRRAAAALINFNVTTGLSAEKLQMWQNAAQFAGVQADAESVTNSISNLESTLQQIKLGDGNTRPFYMFGIDATATDAFGVLEQLRGRIDAFNPAMAKNLLAEMGLGEEMIHVLRMTNEEFEQLGRNYILDNKQTEAVRKLSSSFSMLGRQVTHVKDEAIAFFSPLLISAAQTLGDVVRLLVAPFELLGMLFEQLVAFGRYLDTFLPEWANTTNRIRVGLAAALFVLRPFLATVLTVLLLIEDAITGIQGGTSVLTEALKTLGLFLISGWMNYIAKVKQSLIDLASWIRENVIKPINEMHDMLPDVIPSREGINDALEQGLKVSPLGIAAQGLSNAFNNVFNITTDDPTQAAAVINGALQSQFNQSVAEFGNGGAY